MSPVDISGTVMGESPDCLLLSGTVVGEIPDHVCWVLVTWTICLLSKIQGLFSKSIRGAETGRFGLISDINVKIKIPETRDRAPHYNSLIITSCCAIYSIFEKT